MMTALVIGASGALGRAVTERLRQEGRYRVVGTTRKGDGEQAMPLDVRSGEQIAAVVRRVQPALVLHLAATFADDFAEAHAVNVEAARHLLEAVRQSPSPVRVLLVGSAAEYGAVRPDENPLREQRALAPVSTYGLTKAWQTLLGVFYAARGVDVVSARIFNLDGPNLSERLFVGRLQKQIDDLLAGRRSAIEVGPLSAIRDYVSIEEAAEQMLAIAAGGESGQVYHVASGIPVTMRDILARYLTRYRLDPSVVRSSAELSNHRGYDVPAIYADVTRTMQLRNVRRAGGED